MARIAVSSRDAEWAEQVLERMFGESIRKVRDAVNIDAIFELEGFTRSEAMKLTEDVTEVELIGYGWYEEEDEVDERPKGWVRVEDVVAILEGLAEVEDIEGQTALRLAVDALEKTYE